MYIATKEFEAPGYGTFKEKDKVPADLGKILEARGSDEIIKIDKPAPKADKKKEVKGDG